VVLAKTTWLVASGSGITQNKVWFSYPEGGSPAVETLTNNGTPIAPDQYVTLSGPSGWVSIGSAGSGTDKIWLIASDGQSGQQWQASPIRGPLGPLGSMHRW
jgi:hypothetical protein